MDSNELKKSILDKLVELLELPDSAYDKARNRYESLGKWLGREESSIAENNPHVFPQGSFRLGTAIRPLDNSEEYDLDLACKLLEGVTKETHAQRDLKEIVGNELEHYREAKGIQEKLKEKHRCWRLEYQDDLSFHMDIVPCIPADERRRKAIEAALRRQGMEDALSAQASNTTVSITDDRHAYYRNICENWNISNPEGYAQWFESRFHGESFKYIQAKAQVDDVPVYNQKKPLQRVVQLLKRHRDSWSKDNPESKPISIIITTLAARAYNGEEDIVEALEVVLENMATFVRSNKPKVPNPVDPEEDFADRWYREDSSHLRLENNFYSWLTQARIDFQRIMTVNSIDGLSELIEGRLSLTINKSDWGKYLGFGLVVSDVPKVHVISQDKPAKPWRC